LLTYCCEHSETLSFIGDGGSIRQVIQQKVGLENIKLRLKNLSSALVALKGSREPEAQFFDDSFVESVANLVTTLDSRFLKLLTSPQASRAKSNDKVGKRMIERINTLERSNAQLREKISSLQSNKKEKKKKMREMVSKLIELSQELDNTQTRKLELEALLRQNEVSLPSVSFNGQSMKSNPAAASFQNNDQVLAQQYISLSEEHEDLLVLVSEMDEELELLRREKQDSTLGQPHPEQKPNKLSSENCRLTSSGIK